MSRIFESGAPRDEQQRFDRHMAVRQGLIPGAVFSKADSAWSPPSSLPGTVTVDFSYVPKGIRMPRVPVFEERREFDADAFFENAKAFVIMTAAVLAYCLIAVGIMAGLAWIGVGRPLTGWIGLLWLPIIGAVVLLVKIYRTLKAWYRKLSAFIRAVRQCWRDAGAACGARRSPGHNSPPAPALAGQSRELQQRRTGTRPDRPEGFTRPAGL